MLASAIPFVVGCSHPWHRIRGEAGFALAYDLIVELMSSMFLQVPRSSFRRARPSSRKCI